MKTREGDLSPEGTENEIRSVVFLLYLCSGSCFSCRSCCCCLALVTSVVLVVTFIFAALVVFAAGAVLHVIVAALANIK